MAINPTNIVATYKFNPPIYLPAEGPGVVGAVEEVDVERYSSDDMYDLFDQDGNCLNEGCPFLFLPTRDEVKEFVETGAIKGKIEKIGGEE